MRSCRKLVRGPIISLTTGNDADVHMGKRWRNWGNYRSRPAIEGLSAARNADDYSVTFLNCVTLHLNYSLSLKRRVPLTIITSNMSTDPKFDDLHKQLFEEGLKMRRSVVGDEYVNRALENGSTEFSRAGQELVTEFCWGYAWTRPGLTKQQRSLINIGMLMALNRAPELAVHVRGARNNGLSELEIREAIIHATTYCGVPAGVDAMKTAEKVLNDMAEKGEMPRELNNKSDRA
jgi:4-carboxymuconolactone decarboxylase